MDILLVVAGFVMLFGSGHYLVGSSVVIARTLKLSNLVIGITVVAFGTSAPELVVSLKAALAGNADMALGNVVGSNIANIALITGFVALILPLAVKQKDIWKSWCVMFLATVLLYVFSIDGVLSLVDGVVLLVFMIAYLWVLISFNRKKHVASDLAVQAGMKLWQAGLLLVASMGGLYFGAEWLVSGASNIAFSMGVSNRVIGLTVVAFGTSIPELATSIIASFKRENEISIGNIIGSNIFNILSILGITAVVKPIGVDSMVLRGDYLWLMAISLLLLLFILPLGKAVIGRWKGAVLMGVYIVYVLFLF